MREGRRCGTVCEVGIGEAGVGRGIEPAAQKRACQVSVQVETVFNKRTIHPE